MGALGVVAFIVVHLWVLSVPAVKAQNATSPLPLPFTRVLYYAEPPLYGSDVVVLQFLIARSPFVSNPSYSGEFDKATELSVMEFQKGNGLEPNGIFNVSTANLLLQLHSYDGYKDNGMILPGFRYKIYVPVMSNRSIELNGTLYDSNMNPLLSFRTRTQGQTDPSNGLPYNQFAPSGATPTGLSLIDLNSPEPDVQSFGPYPINRNILGLAGNALFLISNIRDGILIHTGEWPGWTPPNPMPNSHGCIHVWPEDCELIWKTLVSLGVEVRNNTLGKLPYPYPPQGVLSVEQLD